ncbi:MAG: DUF3089 domain-containing protein [Sphingomonadales bacterium]
MARKFLYVVAFLIALVILAGIAWALFGKQIARIAFVPSVAFVEQKAMAPNIYADKAMWYARPDLPGNPAEWRPAGFAEAKQQRTVAVFFIHPTSFLDRSAWNAPLDDKSSRDLAETFIRGQASVFNGVGEVWAPRYRQATFGAFLTTQAESAKALDAAYRDVTLAFDRFVASIPADQPIILAGHSQGALHLTRLLREKIAGQPIARRIVAAYVVGWPISTDHDLVAMGLPACGRPDQAQCILSWQSYAEPADTSMVTEAYDATTGFDGKSRRGSKMLCTNPITGTPDGIADADQNLGTLIPSEDLKSATLEQKRLSARCDERGFLLIGAPPKDIKNYILPGNNFHVFDYSLFWANLRADAHRRLAAFRSTKS